MCRVSHYRIARLARLDPVGHCDHPRLPATFEIGNQMQIGRRKLGGLEKRHDAQATELFFPRWKQTRCASVSGSNGDAIARSKQANSSAVIECSKRDSIAERQSSDWRSRLGLAARLVLDSFDAG